MQRTVPEKRLLTHTPATNSFTPYVFFLLLFLASSFGASSQAVWQKRISLQADNKEVKAILSQISEQAGVKFIYSAEKIPVKKTVSLQANNETLGDVLNKLLTPLAIAYTLSGNQVILSPQNNGALSTPSGETTGSNAATSIIQGKVTDDKGNAVANTSVFIKGKNKGISTNDKGEFSLAAAAGETLSFSSVGFKDTAVQLVAAAGYLRIVLQADAGSLGNVVVVGYGTQKKKDITGAVASFDAKNLEEKPIARIDQAMIGQMAGVQVRQQTGMPGAGLSILVRGSGSVTAGTEPLYVIDGFPLEVSSQNSSGGFTTNPLNNLNPNDIESIQVLKDAAAGAIYGSRAANGVVIITTKRGQTGSAKINFNANTGFSKVSKKLDLLSADEWVAMATEVANYNWVNSGSGRTADQTNAQRRTILGLAPGAVNTSYMTDDRWALPGHPGLEYVDWQDSVYRTAPFQNYEISAGGGTENLHYFFSGNYLNQTGTLIQSGYKNYGVRANVETNANKKLKLGINLAPSYSETNAPDAEGKDNQLMKLAQMVPVVEDTAGMLTGAGKNSTYTWASPRLVSPVAYLNNSFGKIKTTRILSSVYAEYQVVPGVTARTSVNYDENNQTTKKYVSDYVVAGAGTERITNPGKNSSGSYNGLKTQNFVNENTLSYNKTFAQRHSISAVAGVSYSWVHSETISISTAGGYANDLVTTLNNAIANSSGVTVTGSTSESNSTLFSYYGRVQYGYKSKYLLTGSIRRDASSRFGADNQWGTFPSASAGWRISQEPFMQRFSFINDLKLRVSWGKAGNNNIGNYKAIPTLSGITYSVGGNSATAASGQVVSGLANPLLKWETSNTYNAGFDASFLHNRINVSLDVYRKKNTDLLLNIPVLAASGFTSSLQNIGAVVNKGLEVALNTTNITRRNFQWSTNANIAFNGNKVAALGPDNAPIYIPSAYSGSNPPFILQKGLPMYSYYVTKNIGILTADDMANPKVAKLPKQTVGDEKYLDANGDGVIDANDRVVYGQPTPKYTWGLTNNFKYKNFDLSIQVYGQHGGSILSYFGRAIDFSGSTTANVLGIWRDRWTTANQNYNAPRGKFGAAYTVPYVTSDWVYSTDFWRVQNITLGYNLKSILKTPFINGARIYVSAQNYFGKDQYKGGVNPEAQNTNVSGNSSYALPGDYGAMPLSKTITFGVNFTL